MMRAMHERAVGGVNGLLARGWKEATSTHQKARYSSSESRARVMRREVVSSKVPWADAAGIGGDGLRMGAACGWCWGWCDWPAVSALQVSKGARCRSGIRARCTDSLAEILPSRKGCLRVPLHSKLQEVQSSEVSV